MNNEQFTNNKNKLLKRVSFGIIILLFVGTLTGVFFLFRAYQQVGFFPQTSVFLETNLDEAKKKTLEQELGGISGLRFNFVSQEEALEHYQDFHQKDELLLKLVNAQILPAVIELYSNNQPSLDQAVEVISQKVEAEEVREQAGLVSQLKQRLGLIMGAAGGVLALLSGLLVAVKKLKQ